MKTLEKKFCTTRLNYFLPVNNMSKRTSKNQPETRKYMIPMIRLLVLGLVVLMFDAIW